MRYMGQNLLAVRKGCAVNARSRAFENGANGVNRIRCGHGGDKQKKFRVVSREVKIRPAGKLQLNTNTTGYRGKWTVSLQTGVFVTGSRARHQEGRAGFHFLQAIPW